MRLSSGIYRALGWAWILLLLAFSWLLMWILIDSAVKASRG